MGADWTSFGGTFSQRYSTLKQVTSSNAKRLKIAWHAHLPTHFGPGTGMTAGGLEAGGVYYISTGCNDVFALNAATGKQLWAYKSGFPTAGANSSSQKHTAGVVTCSFGNRGMAMGGGKLYEMESDAELVALNQKTGAVAWKTQVAPYTQGFYGTMAPTYYDGMVFASAAGGEQGTRGYMDAYNAQTGKRVWRWYAIPAAGQPAAASWGKGSKLQYGGGNIWDNPVVDPKLGLVYFGTGNASPYASRPKGNDLYTASVIALNVHTGKLKWYYQLVHHDMWDDDTAANDMALFNATVDGQTRYGIAIPTKMGYNFLLDRVTGTPLVPTPEVPQPTVNGRPDASPTQPIPQGDPFDQPCASKAEWLAAGGSNPDDGPDGKPIQFGCDFSPIVSTHYTVPGWHDDADWPPPSYNEATQTEFVCSTQNRGDAYKETTAKAENSPGADYTQNISQVAGDWVAQKIGMLTAINPENNGIEWQSRLPDGNGCYSGTATTAGGLTFVGEFSGHELAYDATTGKLVWQSPRLDATVGAPPIVYSDHGKEYIAVMAGGLGLSAKSKAGNSVYAFKLG